MKSILMLFGLLITTSIFSFSQSADISGILKTQGGEEQLNSICIRFENTMIADDFSTVRNEFAKYGDIVSVGFQNHDGADYVFIKYFNPMTPNQLLGILEKINKNGHYLNSGSPVYYQKDGSIHFNR